MSLLFSFSPYRPHLIWTFQETGRPWNNLERSLLSALSFPNPLPLGPHCQPPPRPPNPRRLLRPLPSLPDFDLGKYAADAVPFDAYLLKFTAGAVRSLAPPLPHPFTAAAAPPPPPHSRLLRALTCLLQRRPQQVRWCLHLLILDGAAATTTYSYFPYPANALHAGQWSHSHRSNRVRRWDSLPSPSDLTRCVY